MNTICVRLPARLASSLLLGFAILPSIPHASAQAPNPVAGSCNVTCKNHLSEHEAEVKRCNAMPEADRLPCHALREQMFGQIKEACGAVVQSGSASGKLKLAAGVYAAAGAVCLSAGWFDVSGGICEGLKWGAMLNDLVLVKHFGQEFASGGAGSIGVGMGLLGSLPGSMAGGFKNLQAGLADKLPGVGSGATNAAKNAADKATLAAQKAAQNATDEASKQAAEEAAKRAKEGVAEAAKNNKVARISSMLQGLTLLATARGKHSESRRSQGLQQDLCLNLARFESNAEVQRGLAARGASTRVSRGADGRGARSEISNRDEAPLGPADFEDLPNSPRLAAALAGDPGYEAIRQMPGIEHAREALSRLGLGPADLAAAAESPDGPASALASAIAERAPALAEAIREADRLALEHDRAVAGAKYAGASKAPAGDSAKKPEGEGSMDLSHLLGAEGDVPAESGAEELDFSGGREPAAESSDIWHEGYPGTIFDIVSRRMEVSRERVHALEWATPLNRALTR